jgi:hypothetical protein
MLGRGGVWSWMVIVGLSFSICGGGCWLARPYCVSQVIP